MDSELRDALSRASAPVEVGPAERHRIRDAVHADRRRRTLLVVAGTVGAVVATAAGVGLLASRSDDPADVTDRGDSVPTGAWEQVAPGPLSPRDHSVAAWTGSEVIVVGGVSGRPCPPDAECMGPSNYRTEAAAYDPGTDTWRELAPAPEAVPNGHALWWDDRLLVVHQRLTLAYDPATDAWERMSDLDDVEAWSGLIATDDGPVLFAYQQLPGSGQKVDWRLDPATGEWSPLPRDPFPGESYDRTMAWYDGRLWLLSMPFASHMEASDGSSSRIAVLDGDTWTVVDEETPDVSYEQRLVRQGDLLVVPSGAYGQGFDSRVFDPSSGEWSDLPDPEASEDSCPLGDAEVGPAWIASATNLFSASPADALAVPPCPEVARPALAVWAGDRLFIWGGPDHDYRRHIADGWVWTPPAPD